jgi:hypothetical protein
MSFEIVYPTLGPKPVSPGEASIAGGTLRMHASDAGRLPPAGEDHIASLAILVDVATRRIGLRRARGSEPSGKITYSKNGATIRIVVKAAMHKLGIDPKAANGKYTVSHKDDLLFIELDHKTGPANPPVGRHIAAPAGNGKRR